MHKRIAIGLSMALALAGARPALAADGDIDSAFGTGGVAATGISNATGGVAACGPVVQPDGKILICSTVDNASTGTDFFVARFMPDGGLDNGFSFDGRVTIDFDAGDGADIAMGLALHADGRIVVVGATQPDASSQGQDFAIVQLLPDGELDTGFGGGSGKRTVAFDLADGTGSDQGMDVAITANGRILVAGTVARSQGSDFGLVRLLADGTPDASFNLTGKVTLDFDLPAGDSTDMLRGIALDDEGRILLVGLADNGPANADFALARLLANGQPDANFDADGRTTVAFDLGGSNSDQGINFTLQRDGRIVVVGPASVGAGSNTDFAIARFLPDGSLDAGFGIGGRTLVPFDLVPNGQDLGLAVVEEANGRLMLAGAAQHAATGLAGAVARLKPDGTLDLGFGNQGKRSYLLGLSTADSQAFLNFAWQGSRLLIGGIGVVEPLPNGIDNFVVRLEIDLLFADGFQ